MRTILAILCLTVLLPLRAAEVEHADHQIAGEFDELCLAASVHGLPIGTDDTTGVAVITRRVLSDLTESESAVFIDLRKDPLAVTTPLPVDRDTLVVIDYRGFITPMVWARARQIADLGYRRVRILWSFGC